MLVHQKPEASIEWDSGGFYKLVIKSTRDASEVIKLKVNDADWGRPWSEQRVRVTDVTVSQRGADLYHAELSKHQAIKTAPPRTIRMGSRSLFCLRAGLATRRCNIVDEGAEHRAGRDFPI